MIVFNRSYLNLSLILVEMSLGLIIKYNIAS